jgi:hypothetical protein
VLSAGGEVRLKRQYRWSRGRTGICPADAALGIERSNLSPGARELCVLMGMTEDFEQARADLKRVGGLTISKERLRQVTMAEGNNARKIRDSGQLPAAWSADQAKLPDGRTRAYGGVDGVLTPSVTQAEKDKRRQAHVTRRQQRGKTGVENIKPLPPPKAGSDEKFKEKKIGMFYNQDKTRRHVFVTRQNSKKFGPLLAEYARQIGLDKADQIICLIDGAIWIYRQICSALLCVTTILLDFFHLAEHVHATARCCLGETETARAWATQLLAMAKTSDVTGMLAAIEQMRKKVRSPAKRKNADGLKQYISKRRNKMLDYAAALLNQQDIGSGPTEATCKTLTLRLKRPGMKWDDDNAAAVMSLTAMRESGQWPAYWQEQRKNAA